MPLRALVDLFRQWRFWKHKRRSLSSGSLDRWRGADEINPLYSHTAQSSENLLAEEELRLLKENIIKLIGNLSVTTDLATCPDEECIVCVSGRRSMQTFPCGHRVLCRICFLRAILVAVTDRQLPLRCVMCRSRVARLKAQTTRSVVVRRQCTPPDAAPSTHAAITVTDICFG